LKSSSSKSVTRYLTSFFWKRDYNTVPSSPGKSVGNSFDLGSTSASPSNVIDFEKDAEEILDFKNEDEATATSTTTEAQFSVDPLRIVDKEFDAEIVEVGLISSADVELADSQLPVVEQLELPLILGEGKILSTSQISKLVKYLPIVLQHHAWVLLYSVLRNGADFTTFFNRTRGPFLLPPHPVPS
jgi:hypothetical protein